MMPPACNNGARIRCQRMVITTSEMQTQTIFLVGFVGNLTILKLIRSHDKVLESQQSVEAKFVLDNEIHLVRRKLLKKWRARLNAETKTRLREAFLRQ